MFNVLVGQQQPTRFNKDYCTSVELSFHIKISAQTKSTPFASTVHSARCFCMHVCYTFTSKAMPPVIQIAVCTMPPISNPLPGLLSTLICTMMKPHNKGKSATLCSPIQVPYTLGYIAIHPRYVSHNSIVYSSITTHNAIYTSTTTVHTTTSATWPEVQVRHCKGKKKIC